jgi:zinc protease
MRFILCLTIAGCLTISWLASFAEENVVTGVQPLSQRGNVVAGVQLLSKQSEQLTYRYAIVADSNTADDAEWAKVITELKVRHHASVFIYNDRTPTIVRSNLAQFQPDYVCFVATPQEANRNFVETVTQMMRELDDDPYPDAIWAILTGLTSVDALKIARAAPLRIQYVALHASGDYLNWAAEGVFLDEVKQQHAIIKTTGGKLKELYNAPPDTTQGFVEAVNKADLVVTSGHATEHDWQMGYTYRSGIFFSRGGGLFALDKYGRGYAINSERDKIYFSPGNCLIAHLSDPNCMALAWMHSGGARQFFGHVVPQYRICTAWGIADYFFKLQDRFTFAEAVYLNRIAALYAIKNDNLAPQHREAYMRCLNGTVLYGDPAWDARLVKTTAAIYEQNLQITSLDDGNYQINFAIKMNQDATLIRPPIALLPIRIRNSEVKDGNAKRTEAADNFILMDVWDEGDAPLKKGDTRQVTVIAKWVKD